MTEYKLKCNFEDLIKKKMTLQIISIFKKSEKEMLKIREIYDMGKFHFQKNFRTDNRCITIMRYLKTMEEYGIVKEKPMGRGKASYWNLQLDDISSKLFFNVLINDHIDKLKRVTSLYQENINFSDNLGINIFNLFPLCFIVNQDEKCKGTKEFHKILKKFKEARDELINLNYKFFRELTLIGHKNIINKCDTWIDKGIVMFFKINLNFWFYEFFDIDNCFVNFVLFKKNKFPYVLNIDDTESFFELLKYFNYFARADGLEFDNQQLIKKLKDYELNKNLSNELFDLFKLYFEFHMSKPNFIVTCELGLKDSIILNDFKNQKLVRNAIKETFNDKKFFQNLLKTTNKDNVDVILNKIAEKLQKNIKNN